MSTEQPEHGAVGKPTPVTWQEQHCSCGVYFVGPDAKAVKAMVAGHVSAQEREARR